jgi:hypothetical protein
MGMPSRTILEIMEPKDSLDDAAQNSGRVLDEGSPQTDKVSFPPPRRHRGHREKRIKRSTGEDYRFARIRGLNGGKEIFTAEARRTLRRNMRIIGLTGLKD